MATFGIVIRNKRSDGFYPVFIRVIHRSRVSYIKTSFVVSERGLKKTYNKTGKEKIEVSDVKIVRECMNEIAGYVRRLNDMDSNKMTVQEITQYLTTEETDLSFSGFAEEYIKAMRNQGRESSSANYAAAVKRLREYTGKDDILFKDLTSLVLANWIESMIESPRKRNLYPACIKTMFKEAMLKYNDEDRDIILIKKNPFNRIKIPKNKPAPKRSTNIGNIRKFFDAKIRESFHKNLTKDKIAKDVCLMVFCLAGINTADLYDLPKEACKNGVLHYNRKKTRNKSDSGAYTEIAIPEKIKPLFEQYTGKKKLLLFSDRYASPSDFANAVAKGCKKICEIAGIEPVTPYSFRHSWATIAINDCQATMDDVAFALNHSSAHKITSTYVRPDYSRIDRLNKKVLGKVFNKRISKKRIKDVVEKRRKAR